MMLRFPVLAACAIGTVAMSSVAMSSASATEAFVGRWAAKAEVCSAHGGDNAANSALVATDTSLWWFEGYCRIGKMYKAGEAVYLLVHCWGEGDVPVTLAARGDRMKVTWNRGKPLDMQRCK